MIHSPYKNITFYIMDGSMKIKLRAEGEPLPEGWK